MIHAVFDTNVVVSAVLKPDGAEARILDLATLGAIQIYVTEAILAEYEDVLLRAKFRRLGKLAITATLNLIRRISILVEPLAELTISLHESDNRFFECAQAARAEYIVTGNKKHFPSNLEGTEIVNARELIEIFTNQILDE